MVRLTLSGVPSSEPVKNNLQAAMDAMNGVGAGGRLSLTGTIEDRDVERNLKNVMDSINGGYTRRLTLSGSVKNLTDRDNLSKIINAHNTRVQSKGDQK